MGVLELEVCKGMDYGIYCLDNAGIRRSWCTIFDFLVAGSILLYNSVGLTSKGIIFGYSPCVCLNNTKSPFRVFVLRSCH